MSAHAPTPARANASFVDVIAWSFIALSISMLLNLVFSGAEFQVHLIAMAVLGLSAITLAISIDIVSEFRRKAGSISALSS